MAAMARRMIPEPRDASSPSLLLNDNACDPLNAGSSRQGSPSWRDSCESTAVRGLCAKREKWYKFVLRVFWRWSLTALFTGATLGLLIHYSLKPVMSREQKYHFNALVTGTSIGLSLSVAKSLDVMIRDMKWRILSRRPRPRHEVELILQADSMTHLTSLTFHSPRPLVIFGVSLWLIVIIGSQVAIAALGLCYSVETAKHQALLVPGKVLLSDVSRFESDTVPAVSIGAQQYVANHYGSISAVFDVSGQGPIPSEGTIWTPGDPLLFFNDHWVYVFHEESAKALEKYNPDPLVVITSRTINATAQCSSWKVVKGGDGAGENITVIQNGSEKNIPIPFAGGVDQKTYFINTTQGCGLGCSQIQAFEGSQKDPWYYECNITVGQVTNARLDQHKVSDEFRTIASGVIALQGYSASSLAKDNALQFQTYPAEVMFGAPFAGDTAVMEMVLCRFTVGAMAAAAEYNPKITLSGDEPTRGSKLDISHMGNIVIILFLVALLQLILDLGIQIWANHIVVPPGGSTALAKVVRAMADSQGNVPSLAAEGNGSKAGSRNRSRWVYRNKPIGDGLFDLYMEEINMEQSPKQEQGDIELN